MAGTPNSIITPQTPLSKYANLISGAALTSRAPITGTTGTIALITTGQNSNGTQINSIKVKGSSSTQTVSTAGLVYIWLYDGTTSWLIDEIAVTAVTPSTTAASFQTIVYYNGFIMAPNTGLYVSSSIATVPLIVEVLGGSL